MRIVETISLFLCLQPAEGSSYRPYNNGTRIYIPNVVNVGYGMVSDHVEGLP